MKDFFDLRTQFDRTTDFFVGFLSEGGGTGG